METSKRMNMLGIGFCVLMIVSQALCFYTMGRNENRGWALVLLVIDIGWFLTFIFNI